MSLASVVPPAWLAALNLHLEHVLNGSNRLEQGNHSGQSLARLWSAMAYAVLNGGKRARALLVMASAEATGADPLARVVLDAAAAVECVHAFSLVHDDLPCMDDDDLRRGQPTVHVAFDEPTALLVGDALQTLAFELLMDTHASDQTKVALCRSLAGATGARGMAGGQAVDIAAVGVGLTQRELEAMHALKTGALITASAEMGVLAGPHASNAAQLDMIRSYARALGLSFQVVDDVLDATADSLTLGKTAGKDQAQDKPTFIRLLGLEASRSYAQSLLDHALASIEPLGAQGDRLRALALALTHRVH
ncbi:MAG: farnesyl diphosphate synthase [Pseudomonadota bacterium]